MKMNTEKNEMICWSCKRNVIGDSTFGLCPNCINTYGTPVAAVGILGIGSIASLGISWVFKNSGKVAKGAFNVIKLIKP